VEMLSCREVTRLCASEDARDASVWTRLGIRLHLAMCRHCRRYVRELARIGAAVREIYGEREGDLDRYDALVQRVLSAGKNGGA